MDYSADAFNMLYTEIERQGGALLPDSCLPLDIEFTVPPYTKAQKLKGKDGEGTCGCGNQTRFVHTYDPGPEAAKPGFVTACAVCDSAGGWPRYRDIYDVLPDDERPRDR